MKRNEKIAILTLGCTMLLLLFAGPVLAQCNLTSGGLDAALSNCSGDDRDCYVNAAMAYPSCAANIAWQYMMLFTPKDRYAVQKQFADAVSDDYFDELSAAFAEADNVITAAEKAGTRTDTNEYPFGQGTEYGQ